MSPNGIIYPLYPQFLTDNFTVMKSLSLFALTIALLIGAYAAMRSDWDYSGSVGGGLGILGLIVGMVALVVNHQEHTDRR